MVFILAHTEYIVVLYFGKWSHKVWYHTLNPSITSIYMYVCSRLLYADQSHSVIAVKAEKSSVFLHFVLFRSQIIHEKPKP